MISGSYEKKIVVSDIVTRQHEAILEAHTRAVSALAVLGRTLLSTVEDCAVRVWVLGIWSHLREVKVIEHVPDARFCYCLAVSGSMLLHCEDDEGYEFGFMAVLYPDTLTCQHTLRLGEGRGD